MLKLVTGMEQVKHTLKVHSTMLTSIMRKTNQDQQSAMELPQDIRFPLENTAEVDELEIKLKNVPTKKLMVSLHVVHTISVSIALCCT